MNVTGATAIEVLWWTIDRDGLYAALPATIGLVGVLLTLVVTQVLGGVRERRQTDAEERRDSSRLEAEERREARRAEAERLREAERAAAEAERAGQLAAASRAKILDDRSREAAAVALRVALEIARDNGLHRQQYSGDSVEQVFGEKLARFEVEVLQIRHPEAREALFDGMRNSSYIGRLSSRGLLAKSARVTQIEILDSIIATLAALLRGDDPDRDDIATLDELSAAQRDFFNNSDG